MAQQTQNVVLVTLDGLRWETLYRGLDQQILKDKQSTSSPENMVEKFGGDRVESRAKIFPWVWSTAVQQGQLYGNRDRNAFCSVTNPYAISYPGYSEMITGYGDPRVDSNAKVDNPNISVFEVVNKTKKFKNKVAVFGSWERYPEIFNSKRSHIFVNAGFTKFESDNFTDQQLFSMQDKLTGPCGCCRQDALTFALAKSYIKQHQPRLLQVSFNLTDEYAHAGSYNRYIEMAHNSDLMIGQLWDFMQNIKQYKGKTTFIITTDHGRGMSPKSSWRDHGVSALPDAANTWMIVLGPDTKTTGEMIDTEIHTNQIAATIAQLLKVDYQPPFEIGAPISSAIQ
ncbi:sulfatase-like hydrolase/transferase [Persicobacter psychrovividus]|uniref:Sulfatase N-terminal domain-containing protein n=1 Tax=Persicobacter psychrovividus TaxID=387638 RepID=A0ABM7VJN4_9BACT|nr:hypothetical protein PEPS_34700 [Persicobacter psychrovividus]